MSNHTETSTTWLLKIKEVLASMPLSLKLMLLVLVTLITRFIAFLQTQVIANDGMLYIQLAKLFSEGKYEGIGQYEGIPRAYFNLYPLIISFVQKFIGDWELSGQLISMSLGTLTVIPIFLLGRSLYGEKVGWFSALFYFTLPNFLRYDSEVLRDPTNWFLMAWTLWLVWVGLQRNRPALLGLASVSAGLGTMTRIEGIILWGAVALYTIFQRTSGISLKRRGFNVTLLILLFPLLLSPFLLSMKKHVIQIAFNEMSSFSINAIKENIRLIRKAQDPVNGMGQKAYDSLPNISQQSLDLAGRHRFILAIAEVAYKFIKSANLLFALILLGLWKRKREGFESPDWYLLWVFVVLFGMFVFYARQTYYVSTRHGLTLVLPSIYFAGHGLIIMTEIISRGITRFLPKWSMMKRYVFHILTFFLILIFIVQGLAVGRSGKANLKKVGLWLKENGYQGSVMMGSDKFHRLVFYADGKFREMPDSWESVVTNIQQKKVRLIIIDSWTIEQDCPGFRENWLRAGLFPLQGPKGKKEKCEIQIYGVY